MRSPEPLPAIRRGAFRIGDITVPRAVALAPMAGVTDRPFRMLVRRFGLGLAVTEMIASREAVRAAARQRRWDADFDAEQPVSVQLAGTEPDIMAEAARLAVARGAKIIDLNFGCPARKVVKKAAGCALMADEDLAGRIIEAVVRAVAPVPVTLKMRAGYRADHRNAPSIARLAEQAGIKMLTVHGRTGCQKFNGRADWDVIGAVRRAVSLPVIGNGDIASPEDAAACVARTGCDAVMVGRASYGRPWLAGQIADYLETGRYQPAPSAAARLEIVLGHYRAMLDSYGVMPGLLRARKHLGWYLSGLRDAAAYREAINREQDPAAVERLVVAAFAPTTR